MDVEGMYVEIVVEIELLDTYQLYLHGRASYELERSGYNIIPGRSDV